MRQLLILALLTGGIVNAQTLTLSASAPTPVSSLSASRVGVAGSTTYCYHVIAVYPIGRTAETVACVTNGADTLSVSNWNRVAWGSLAGATGYYLIRNSTPDTIGSCTSCLLVNNTLVTTVNDDGSISPGNYTAISPASPVSVTVSLNNQSFPNPQVMFPTYTLNVTCLQFPDATQMCSGSPSASGTVTHLTGPLTAGQLIIGNGLGDIKVGDLSGDVSTSGGTATTLGIGVVGLTNLNPFLFSGTGTAFCTVTGTLGSTHVVRFDASGNCVQSSATIDNSGNYSSPGSSSTGVGGTVAGASFFGVQASGPSLPAGTGYAGIGVGTGAIAASYGLLMPTTGPSGTSTIACPVLSAGFSQCTFVPIGGGGGSPGGGDTAVQFNHPAGTFAGDETNFAWDDVNKGLLIASPTNTGVLGYALNVSLTSTTAANIFPLAENVNVVSNNSSGTAGDVIGLSSSASQNGAGNADNIYGGFFEGVDTGGGVSTNIVGVKSIVDHIQSGGVGTVGTLIGIESTAKPTSVGVTDAIGLLIDDVSGATNNYAIKTGLGKVQFGDTLQLHPTSTDPVCSAAGDIGKTWLDSTSAVTTHFKVCVEVASTPTWVTVF